MHDSVLTDGEALREDKMGSQLTLTAHRPLDWGLAVVIALVPPMALTSSLCAQEPSVRPSASAPKHWDATAPGRVEPASQAIRMAAPIAGRIAEVLVKANDKTFAGQLLVRLSDDEARARLAGAAAQVALRQRARNDEKRKGSEERRRNEDAVADAERSVIQAQSALDKAVAAAGQSAASNDELEATRSALSRAQVHLREQRDKLAAFNAGGGALPTRAEGELAAARADWTVAEAEIEKTRIRAPLAGTVLQVQAKVGEMALPSSEHPLVLLGDLTALRVRAELDERDFVKVRVGQRVLVRAHAFRDREFDGRVSSIAQYVEAGRMTSAEQRKLSDVDVAEVIVDLSDPGPLVVGMQVDAYFSSENPEQQGAR